ncbi:MAG: Ig-like domain-containing protein [Patescibacteria group bacterium]
MITKNTLIKTISIVSGFMLVIGLLPIAMEMLSATAQETNPTPIEPICQTEATGPSWNPYPLTTTLDSPDIMSNACKDMPLLSHFPVNFRNNNPREKTIIQGQDISFHLYYNNGAIPDASGNPRIANPNVKVELLKESETRYRLRATLSGSNVPSVTSQQKGGDLIINTPPNTSFRIVGRDTRHYIDAVERKYAVDQGQRAVPYDFISDNSTGNIVSNPIWTAFPDINLPSTSGYQIKPSLEAGFLGYGYILFSIIPVETPQPKENLPPVCAGQEITIIEGQTGSFERLNCTDPDNDYPLTIDTSRLTNDCTVTTPGTGQNGPNSTGPIISCPTNSNTPRRFQFPVIPTDSKGLVGTPGTLIVNVIKPEMSATKECVVKGTQTPCASTTLQAGDEITYRVNVNSTGTYKLTNLTVTDNYDQEKLTNVTNASDNGQINNGVITWSLGDLEIGRSKTVTFDATIANTVKDGDIVVNVAIARADNVPDVTARVEFPIVANVDLTAIKECVVKGTNDVCAAQDLRPGSEITYKITARNTTNNTVRNLKIVDTYDKVRVGDISNISDNGQLSNDVITWNLGDLAGNASKSVTFDGKVTASALPGDNVINVAKISATDIPEITVQVPFPVGGDTAIISTSNKLCFKLNTTTNCADATLKPNEFIRYQINVKNTGKDTAKNVTVTDTYDKLRITNIRNLKPSGSIDTSTGKITWSLGDLAAGQTTTLEFDATIVPNVINNDIIVNSAIIKADNLPDQYVSVQFPISLNILPPANTPTPRSGGVQWLTAGIIALLSGFGFYYYKKHPKWATGFIPKRSTEVKLKKK